jgi:glucan phosphorylase
MSSNAGKSQFRIGCAEGEAKQFPLHSARTVSQAILARQVIKAQMNRYSRHEPGGFAPIIDAFLNRGDHYVHLADLRAYLEADRRLRALCAEPDARARKAIVNIAASGKFSSDRTIAEHTGEIWQAEPCSVP